MSFGDDNPFVFGVLHRSALGWRDEHLAAGTAATEASEALHFDGSGAAPGALRAGRRSTLERRGSGHGCRGLVQGGEWPDPAGRPGRERFLDMGLDNRLVADSDGTRLSDGIRTLNVRRSRTSTLSDG